MAKHKKLLFVISSLQGGGAERVVCMMANHWAGKGHDITIITLAGPDAPVSYSLLPAVKLEALGILGKAQNALLDNMGRIKRLRSVLKTKKADVIFSFMESTNVLSILSAAGLRTPVIVADRNNPKLYGYGRLCRFLRNMTYPFSSVLVVQTKAVLEYYPSFLARKARVIPNFVEICQEQTQKQIRARKKIICAVGRLDEQKDFDTLILAFAKIAEKYPDWALEIWGEGPERKKLENLRDKLGLSERISFPGFSENIKEIMAYSGLFVLSSRFEGFPNALLEAMACGTPVISTKCPCGPSEIVTHEQDGFLVSVGDVESLAKTIERLLEDETLRNELGNNACKVRDQFHPDRIMTMWEELICAA